MYTAFIFMGILFCAVPPDNACSKLPDVENGGIIYDDLNLGSGATGRYICDEGYSLHLFQSRHVFTCTEDGIWDGNVTTVPVQCLCKSISHPPILLYYEAWLTELLRK